MRVFAVALVASMMSATMGGTIAVSTVSAVSTFVSAESITAPRIIGTSVEGRPIEAYRRGTPGGTVVLVIGDIHGDESDGIQIVDKLKKVNIPRGIDLWLVPSMNPDGVANNTRTNANGVDLNRNFPFQWKRIGKPGYWQYSGTSKASEPETKAIVKFIRQIQPRLGIWYHQDLNIITPGTGIDGELRARYSKVSGIPLKRITGGSYWGIAATWQRNIVPDAYAFVVELGPTLSLSQVTRNTDAVLDVAVLLRSLQGK